MCTALYTSVKIKVGCRDDTIPKTVDTRRALQGMVESMQQSSTGRGLREIVACSEPYLAGPSCIYSFWHGVIPLDGGNCCLPDFHKYR